MSIAKDIQKLDPGAIVDVFELDATEIGGAVFRWSNFVNELGDPIVWDGDEYTQFPIEAEGFEKDGNGKSPRPSLRVANVTGLIGALARELDDLAGAKVIRRRTFVKYLDAVNFAEGNPTADPSVKFTDEVWFVERKTSENGIFVEFELASAYDLSGQTLPRRPVVQNVCIWQYRSTECGYAGDPVADQNDNPTAVLAQDKCGKRIGSCALRFGDNVALPFGSFPGVGKL